MLPPTRHQGARIKRDVGEARITAAAPQKATAPPTGSFSVGLGNCRAREELAGVATRPPTKLGESYNPAYSIRCNLEALHAVDGDDKHWPEDGPVSRGTSTHAFRARN